jgi:hypothetical protein
MDDQALTQLNADQIAALSDELKAVFCAMEAADQSFFATTFKPTDLAKALNRKGEILQRNQAERERMEKLKAFFAQSVEAHPPEADGAEGALTAVAMGALGIGAAVATDNTAHFRGVKPAELIPALRAEFGGGKTSLQMSGREEALTATVGLWDGSQSISAMTINLTQANDGVEVKVNDLTTRGVLTTLKEGGMKLLGAAEAGFDLLRGGARSPMEFFDRADEAISAGTGLAEAAGNLKLKERAWKVIKQAAESIEANFLSLQEEERKARAALEAAWDRYYNCPTCGVSFQPEDNACRVCGTARPTAPTQPDPRQQ